LSSAKPVHFLHLSNPLQKQYIVDSLQVADDDIEYLISDNILSLNLA